MQLWGPAILKYIPRHLGMIFSIFVADNDHFCCEELKEFMGKVKEGDMIAADGVTVNGSQRLIMPASKN